MFTIQNKKIILSIVSLIVVSVFLIVAKSVFDSRNNSILERPVAIDTSNEENRNIIQEGQLKSKLLNIKTKEGDILMYDPREIEGTADMGAGIFSMTTLDDVNTQTFGIIFNENNGSFAVGLEIEPVSKARLAAELYLQQALNIEKKDLCSLNIFVGVPNNVNQFYSGQNLGLSFCPGSVSLE